MPDTDTQLIVGAITNLREDINTHHKENKERLERAEARQDKFEDTISTLAENMNTLATSMVRLEEVQERMEKDTEKQRVIDEAQDAKIEIIKDTLHSVDKQLTLLREVPDELKMNRHGLKDLENRVNALNVFQDGQLKTINEVKAKVEALEKKEILDTAKLDSMEAWSKWFKEKILPAIILAGVPAAVMYWLLNAQ